MSLTAGPIRIAILANGRQARAEATLTARSYGLMGRQVSRTGKLLAGAFAVSGIVRAAAAAGRAGATYVSALNKVQALTDSTDRQIDRAAQRIEKNSGVFAKYGQTAADAAAGVVELTKSGLSLGSSLRAVRGTMVLAKAGELEVADASMLVANTLNTFGLKAKAASRIANGLANAANISSADVSDLAESFKYVSPLAAKAGVSLDQTNAILAELANSGIKASQAGTAFRSFLLNLQAPTPAATAALKALNVETYDAQGNMRPLPNLIDQLNRGLGRLSQEQQNANLKAIFGKVGITGAQVILKNGTKGLAEYTKGVKRAGAAQKLAAAATKGLAGTLASLKAQTVTTVQELYRRFSPALDARLQSVASYLADNKDAMIDAGIAAAKRLGPALKSLAGLAKSAAEALADTAVPIVKDLLPAVETLADLAGGLADVLDGLPGPVKEIGVQAGIAALILPRLTAGIAAAVAAARNGIVYTRVLALEMQTASTRANLLSTAMTKLRGAASAAAGIGGMVLLAQSADEANKSLGFLEKTAAGGLLGASVGGPWGAAIGTAAGALYGLASATRSAAVETVTAKDNTKAYVDTLNELTGASTRATRARIFDRLMADKATASMVTQATKAGVASRDIVSAVMGQRGAWNRLGGALEDAQRKYDALKNPESARGRALAEQIFALRNLTPALRAETSALASSIAATKAKADAVVGWGKALKGVPPEARAELRNANYDLTRKQVEDLVEKYDLLPAQKQTILTALGVAQAKTKAQQALTAYDRLPPRVQTEIREVGGGETIKRLKQIGRQYDLTPQQLRLLIQATGAKATIKQITGVRSALEVTGKAKPGTQAWLRSLTSDVGRGKQQATRGGRDVQRGLEQGPKEAKADLSGYNASLRTGLMTSKRWATEGGTQVGANLKSGVLAGFAGTAAALAAQAASAVRQAVAAAREAGRIRSPSKEMDEKVGKPLAQGLLGGFTREVGKGSEGIRRALDKLKSLIEKRLDGTKQAGRRKALLKSLKAEGAALRANGKLQDEIAKKLEKARDRYKQLIATSRQFAASVKAGFQAYGSVVGLGTTGGGTAVTLPALLSQLAARAEVAQQFTAIIEQLKGKLNKTSLRQLLEQAAQGDLEGALAAAQAIASGGSAAVAQVNSLTAQISQAGAGLGESAAQSLFGAGIRAAEGIVAGLKRRERKLDKIADRLADRLIDRIQKQLGIGRTSAPSRVAGRALATDTYTSRTPALDAYMRQVTQPSTAPTFTVAITLSAQQLSELEQGRKIQVSLDAYHAAGGRSKVKQR